MAGLRGANLALLVLLGAVWGTAFMFISLGLPHVTPVYFAAVRFDLAAAGVAVLWLARRARGRGARELVPRGRAQWTAVAVAAALNVGAYHALLFWAQNFTPSAIAAVIVALNPMLTTVFSRFLLEDERLGGHGLAGLALGLLGFVALALLKGGGLDQAGLAEVVILGAVASWALGSTIVRRTRHGMDVFAFTTWHMAVGAALLHVVALALEGGGRASWNAASLASLLYLALVSSSLGFVIFFTLLERVGPIRSTLVSYLAPIFAAVAALAVLDQGIEPRAVVAYALIAAGFGLVARPSAGRS